MQESIQQIDKNKRIEEIKQKIKTLTFELEKLQKNEMENSQKNKLEAQKPTHIDYYISTPNDDGSFSEYAVHKRI